MVLTVLTVLTVLATVLTALTVLTVLAGIHPHAATTDCEQLYKSAFAAMDHEAVGSKRTFVRAICACSLLYA